MNIREIYDYFFYKIYKFWELVSLPKFWSDWKATLTIDILEIMLGLSAASYYTFFTGQWIDFSNAKVLMLSYISVIALPNYFLFTHNARWKDIVEEYEKYPANKNRAGSIIVAIIILIIVGNLFFSFYLLGKVPKL